jgi:hypothetical protein
MEWVKFDKETQDLIKSSVKNLENSLSPLFWLNTVSLNWINAQRTIKPDKFHMVFLLLKSFGETEITAGYYNGGDEWRKSYDPLSDKILGVIYYWAQIPENFTMKDFNNIISKNTFM